MTHLRTRTLLPLLAVALVLVPLGPARAAQGDPPPLTGEDNIAIAANTEDGSVVFEFAFSVRRVYDSVVDPVNLAAALGSCTDCTTVAVAFQAVLAIRDVDVLAPLNVALAANQQCVECFTYASATQLVFGYDRNVRITGSGRQRLHDVERFLRYLQDHAAELTPGQIVAAVNAAEIEFTAIMAEEVVLTGQWPPPQLTTEPDTPATPPESSPTLTDSTTDSPPESSTTPIDSTTDSPPISTVPSVPDPSADTTTPASQPTDSVEPSTTTAVPPTSASATNPTDPPASSTSAATQPVEPEREAPSLTTTAPAPTAP